MRSIATIILMISLLDSPEAQVDPFCNNDDCGALDPSWQLLGDKTVACEGETFFLRSGESIPYNNIDSYTWILTNTFTDEEVLNQTLSDTTLLEFTYEISDSIACLNNGNDGLNFEVRLVVTSPNCNGEDESCRYSAEPLSILFRARARFEVNTVLCINEDLTITNTSCNADDEKYVWDFGNGNSSTDIIPIISYSTPGLYTVTLTADNDCDIPDQTTKPSQL